MSRKTWWVAGVVLVLMAAGMGRAIVARKAEKAAITQSGAGVGQVPLTLRDTDWLKVTSSPLNQTLPISGPLKAVRTAVVKARVAGELQSLAARPGESVKAGQVLARIDAGESQQRLEQARQQASAAEAQLAIARQTLENNQSLVRDGFISRTALDTSVANANAAQANLQAARAAAEVARKTLSDTQLTSPIAGQISQQFAQVGERMAIDGRIAEVVDLSAMEMEASLSVAELQGVKVGHQGSVRIEGLSDAIGVTVSRINPGASIGSRAVTVYLSVKPHPMLRHGLFAQGTLNLDRREGLVVPQGLVRQGPNGPFVLRIDQGQVEHRPVVVAAQGVVPGQADAAPMLLIDRGLTAGDRVLRETVGALQAGTRLR